MRIANIEFENFRNFRDHGEIKCSTDGKVTIIYGKTVMVKPPCTSCSSGCSTDKFILTRLLQTASIIFSMKVNALLAIHSKLWAVLTLSILVLNIH